MGRRPSDGTRARPGLPGRVGTAVLLAVLCAVAWWPLGFLPWLTSGLSWATSAATDASGLAGVRLALPLAAHALPTLAACALLGGVAAGLLPVTVVHLPRLLAVVEAWLVTLAVCLVALYLSARTLRHAVPGDFTSDKRVLAGLGAAVLLFTVVGLVLGTASVRWFPVAAPAAGIVAGAAPTWIDSFWMARPLPDSGAVTQISQIAVAVVLSAGLLAAIRRGPRGMIAWPFAVLMWLLTWPVFVAIGYLTPMLSSSRGLPGALPGDLRAAGQVFGQALWHGHRVWWPVLVALAVGLAGAAIQWLRRPRVARAADVDEEPPVA